MSRGRWITLAVWGAGLALLAWALQWISWPDLWALLRRMPPAGLLLLILLNGVILLALTGRWRVFAGILPQRISFFTLFQARLAAFAISYFTPGPQFGGEPLQIIALRRQQVPAAAATSTVALDKLVELLANFTVLALGAMALWAVDLGDVRGRGVISLLALLLLALPLIYLALLRRKRHPFVAISRWLVIRRPEGRLNRGLDVLARSEALAGVLARERPGALLRALIWAGAAWVLMLLEFGLGARFLGAPLSPIETLAALAAARFAFLLPMPGGLGALVSSQVLVFTALGYDPNAALALTLYIRARDLLIGAVGGIMVARMLR